MTTKHTPATPLPWSSMRDASTGAQDQNYIAHAANAYPRLVEALRVSLIYLDPDGVDTGKLVPEYRALLAELGE